MVIVKLISHSEETSLHLNQKSLLANRRTSIPDLIIGTMSKCDRQVVAVFAAITKCIKL